jgi:hypothetical protein
VEPALWKWYRVAEGMGHQENYLKRITAVAREVVDGKELSEKASQAMAKDCQQVERSHNSLGPGAAIISGDDYANAELNN